MEQILSNCDQFNYGYASSLELSLMLRKIFRSETKDYEIDINLSLLHSILASLSIQPHIHSIYMYYNNPYGRFLTAAEKYYSYLDSYYDTEWFSICQEASNKRKSFSVFRTLKRYSFESEATPVITYFIPIKDSKQIGNVGYTIVNLDYSYLLESLVNTLSSGKDGQLFAIFNEENELLLHSPQLEPILINPRSEKISGKGIWIDEIRYITISRESERNHWHYYLFTPQMVYFRIPILVLSLILLFMVLLIIIEIPLENKLWTAQSTERKYHMQALELLALQSQINPHFLFNTLHFINWNVISLTKGPNTASEMIENLSTMLDYSLREPLQEVWLTEELKCAQCYIDIIKARFPDNFRIHWEFDDQLPEIKMPKLLLQPLLENCIFHGAQPDRNILHINVIVKKIAGTLLISITDNGMGITENQLTEIREKLKDENHKDTRHVGIFNINKRLRLYYEKEYSLSIDSKPEEGTTVSIHLPLSVQPSLEMTKKAL